MTADRAVGLLVVGFGWGPPLVQWAARGFLPYRDPAALLVSLAIYTIVAVGIFDSWRWAFFTLPFLVVLDLVGLALHPEVTRRASWSSHLPFSLVALCAVYCCLRAARVFRGPSNG